MNELKNVNPDDLKRWAHPIALMTQSNNQEIRELAESQLKKIVAERPEIKTESHASVCHLYNQEIGNFAENAIRLTDSLQINVLHVSSAQNSTKKTFNHTKGQKIVIRMPMYPSNVANNCKARIKRLAKINKNKSVEWNMRKLLQDMRGDQKLINIIKLAAWKWIQLVLLLKILQEISQRSFYNNSLISVQKMIRERNQI